MKYTKQPKTYLEQIARLKKRGLNFDDINKAEKILSRLSYYRISAYFLYFQAKKDIFNEDSSFSHITELYTFDHKFRMLLFYYLQILEISIRTTITYELSHKYGAFFYRDKKYFRKKFDHKKWLAKVEEQILRSNETFVDHYKRKYKESKDLPIWMITELISFGSLSILFSGLQTVDRTNIANKYNIDFKTLQSWIHSISYIRNICAHHSRLFNKQISIKAHIPPLKKEFNFPYKIYNDKLFSILTIMKYMLDSIEFDSRSIKTDLITLFDKYPVVKLKSLGIPLDWENHAGWK